MAYEYQLEWWRPQTTEAGPAPIGDGRAMPQQGSLPFWCAIVFTGVLIFSPQNYLTQLAPLRLALFLMVVGFLSYASDRWRRRLPLFHWHREYLLIVALAGVAAVTVPVAIWPGGSFSALLQYLKTAAVVLLLSNVISTSDRLQRTAWILTAMAMCLGLFAMYNFATGAFVDQGMNNDRLIGNEGSLTKNPNDLALMINLLLPLTIALLLISTPPWQRCLLQVAIGMEALTVVLTHSRAGTLTLCVIFVAYLWKLRRTRGRSWIYTLLLVGVFALPFLPSSYLSRMSTIANVQADPTGSAQERLSDIMIATKTILAHPVVGAGIGMNMLAMREARGGWLNVHNVYLEHAIDLGLPGLALFLALLASCIKATGSIQKSDVPREMFFLAQGLQVSLIAYATAAMFHPVSYHFYFYYVVGLVLAAKMIAQREARRAVEAAA